MKCEEIRGLAPMYLTGEMDALRREQFAAHVRLCPECEREIDSQVRLDARLAGVLARQCPDSSRVEHRFRAAVAAERSRRLRFAGIAAAAVIVAGLAAGGLLFRPFRPAEPAWLADAARDHWSELVEKQPRRWRSTEAEIGQLAARHGLSYAQVARLAAPGYFLEQAKNCGIGRQPMLHLVFSNGGREYSVFVRQSRGATEPVRVLQRDAENAAGMETGRYRAAVVMLGSRAECDEFARLVASRL